MLSSVYHCRPSEILRLEDVYEAWCLDEAIAHLTARLRRGDKLKPEETENNFDLIEKILHQR